MPETRWTPPDDPVATTATSAVAITARATAMTAMIHTGVVIPR